MKLWHVGFLVLLLSNLLGAGAEVYSQDLDATFENDYYRFDYPSTWEITETEEFWGGVIISFSRDMEFFVQHPFRLRMEDPHLINAVNTAAQDPNGIEEVSVGDFEALSYHYGEYPNIGLLFALPGNYFVNINFGKRDASREELEQYHELVLSLALSYQANMDTIDEVTTYFSFQYANPHATSEEIIQELLDNGLLDNADHLISEERVVAVRAGDIHVFESDDYHQNIVMAASLKLRGSGSCGLLSHIQLDDEGNPENYLQIAISDNILWTPPENSNPAKSILFENTMLSGAVSFDTGLLERREYHMIVIIDQNILTVLINGYVVIVDYLVLAWEHEAGAYGFGLIDTRDSGSISYSRSYGDGFYGMIDIDTNDTPPTAVYLAEGSCTASDIWFYALPD